MINAYSHDDNHLQQEKKSRQGNRLNTHQIKQYFDYLWLKMIYCLNGHLFNFHSGERERENINLCVAHTQQAIWYYATGFCHLFTRGGGQFRSISWHKEWPIHRCFLNWTTKKPHENYNNNKNSSWGRGACVSQPKKRIVICY